jgi:hypothetical protein
MSLIKYPRLAKSDKVSEKMMKLVCRFSHYRFYWPPFLLKRLVFPKVRVFFPANCGKVLPAAYAAAVAQMSGCAL